MYLVIGVRATSICRRRQQQEQHPHLRLTLCFGIFFRRRFITRARQVPVRHRPDLATARDIRQRPFAEQLVSNDGTIS